MKRKHAAANRAHGAFTTVHPGELLAGYMEFYKWAPDEVAARAGLTPSIILALLARRGRVTAPIASGLERAFGRPAHLWLNLQKRYDNG